MPSTKSDPLCKEFMEQRIKIFESAELSDCSFLVGPESEQELFPSYKGFLAISSPVFKAMFYGNLAEKNEPITIPDIHPAHFKILLNYIFRNQIELSSLEEAGGVYYCAKKFLLPHLQEICSKYFFKQVNSSNVCQVYEYAQLFEDTQLLEKTTEIMTDATKLVLRNPNFLKAQFSTLLYIFSLDKMCIDSEMELLEAAMRYNEAHEKQTTKNETSDKIKLPIQSAIEKIRFLTVTPTQFVESPSREFLLESEVLAILVNMASSNTNIPYPKNLCLSRESRVEQSKTKTFSFRIEDFSNLHDEIHSTHYYLCDICFDICVRPETFPFIDEGREKFLGVHFNCDVDKTLSNWRLLISFEVKLCSQKTSFANITKSVNRLVMHNIRDGHGWKQFVAWKDVLDPIKGYLKEGALILEVSITVHESNEYRPITFTLESIGPIML